MIDHERVRRQICVCTISLARDKAEARLIHATLQHLSRSGLAVIVADGGSPSEFIEAIAALPNLSVVTPQQPGLVGQVQAAFAAARVHRAAFLLYLESDKRGFAEEQLGDYLARADTEPDVGAVLAARSDRAFATFPPVQRSTEARINTMTGDAVGRRGDYSYGPFLLNAELAGRIGTAPASLGWGWRHFMFGLAHRLGYRLVHVTGDYECPTDQRQEGPHERRHRERQLDENLAGLRLSLTMPL